MSVKTTEFEDVFCYSKQLLVVLSGFLIVLIGVAAHINSVTGGKLEPFGPKIMVTVGLFIFIISSLWLIEGLNRLRKNRIH